MLNSPHIPHYVCPTCGYEKAVWHLSLNTTPKNLCENCFSDFTAAGSHINSFNRAGRKNIERTGIRIVSR